MSKAICKEFKPEFFIQIHCHIPSIPLDNTIWAVTKETISVQFSHSVMSNSLRPHGLQQTRLPCPSPTPRACSNSCPLSQWCHPTISLSVVPFSSHLQSFPASGSFPISPFFSSGGQSNRVSASASVLPMNIQNRFPLGWTGLISLQSKGLSRNHLLVHYRDSEVSCVIDPDMLPNKERLADSCSVPPWRF